MDDEIVGFAVIWGIIVVLVFVVLGGVTWWSAGQEVAAYERVTGKQVAQWDALFLELRVQ